MSFFTILLLIAAAIYFGLRYVYSYWRRKGFPEITPSIPFGNLSSFMKQETSFGVNVCDLYWESKAPLLGIYLFFKPALLVRDAVLAKRIMTTDFEFFRDRGVFYAPEQDSVTAHLFSMPGQAWKDLRVTMTPLFTAGKLRSMFSILLTSGQQLSTHVDKELSVGTEVFEVKDLMSRYVLNSIASIFWGLDIDTIKEPEHPFRQIAHIMNAQDFVNKIKSAAVLLCPTLLEKLKLRAADKKVYDFLDEFLGKNVEYRQRTGMQRNDFLQLLLALKDQDKLKYEQVIGNVFLFYIAGSETSASLASFCLYEVCRKPEVMQQLVDDIDSTLAKHNGEINYDSIKEMKYLDFCTKETLRKVPGLPILNRICVRDYRVPDSDTVIKKGTSIILPILSYHTDPQYFPTPSEFIPERFDESDENPLRYNHDAYHPFGDGPRACIAVRMGIMVAKVALVYMLSQYKCQATTFHDVEFDNFAVGLMPKGGLNIKFGRRDKASSKVAPPS